MAIALQSSYAQPDSGPAGGAPNSNPFVGPGGGSAPADDPRYRVNPNSAPVPTPGAAVPGATPFAPPPSFMTPALQQYVNQFRQSQSAQQQALNAGLVQALQGLGERRDAAAKVSATLPAEYQKQYAAATASQHAAAHAGDGITGPAPTSEGNAEVAKNNALITAANTQEQAAGLSNQPLLQAGITADYSKGKTTLSNTDMANKAAVAQQQEQFDQQMAMAQAQWQQQQQSQQAGYAHDIEMAQLQSTLGVNAYKAENPNAALTPAQQAQMANKQALDQKAINAGFTSYDQAQQVMSGSAYQHAVSILNGANFDAGGTKLKGGDVAGLVKFLQQANPDVLKALVYNGIVSMPSLSATGQVTKSQYLE